MDTVLLTYTMARSSFKGDGNQPQDLGDRPLMEEYYGKIIASFQKRFNGFQIVTKYYEQNTKGIWHIHGFLRVGKSVDVEQMKYRGCRILIEPEKFGTWDKYSRKEQEGQKGERKIFKKVIKCNKEIKKPMKEVPLDLLPTDQEQEDYIEWVSDIHNKIIESNGPTDSPPDPLDSGISKIKIFKKPV